MHVDVIDGDEPKVRIELGAVEVYHLLVFLLHAKFSDDVRLDIVGSPTMQGLLADLVEAQKTIGSDMLMPLGPLVFREGEGLCAPPSFAKIEAELQRLLGKADVGPELESHLFPCTWVREGKG